jgi:hypothetical protein
MRLSCHGNCKGLSWHGDLRTVLGSNPSYPRRMMRAVFTAVGLLFFMMAACLSESSVLWFAPCRSLSTPSNPSDLEFPLSSRPADGRATRIVLWASCRIAREHAIRIAPRHTGCRQWARPHAYACGLARESDPETEGQRDRESRHAFTREGGRKREPNHCPSQQIAQCVLPPCTARCVQTARPRYVIRHAMLPLLVHQAQGQLCYLPRTLVVQHPVEPQQPRRVCRRLQCLKMMRTAQN